ncbi:MAG: hypothetical protein ABW118_19395 [Candidatus Thiodiazotropha sp.]
MTDRKQYLSTLYFDPEAPASYLGPEKLYQIVKSQADTLTGTQTHIDGDDNDDDDDGGGGGGKRYNLNSVRRLRSVRRLIYIH